VTAAAGDQHQTVVTTGVEDFCIDVSRAIAKPVLLEAKQCMKVSLQLFGIITITIIIVTHHASIYYELIVLLALSIFVSRDFHILYGVLS
jgi:hypothetical protein